MSRYAETTTVEPIRSREQIERLLMDHGATGFHYGWDNGAAVIEFVVSNRQVRFCVPALDSSERRFQRDGRGSVRTPKQRARAMEQADRQRWRALYLVVRAKLEAVESGIATFDREFLAYVVMPNGRTIGDALVPQLEAGAQLRLGDGGRA